MILPTRGSRWVAGLGLGLLVGCADTPVSPDREVMCEPTHDADKFIVLPDTQFYSCAYAEIFYSQTDWIADHAEDMGIGIVLHTGDIVDADVSEQWATASTALHRLDGIVPYLLVPGNHDLRTSRASMLDEHFAARDASLDGCAETGFKTEGELGNAYSIVRLGGSPWLFIGLEFAPRDATLDWAASVLVQHSALPAVIFTHAYLYSGEQRYDRAITPPQRYHPDAYGFTPSEGVADGQDIWETIVEPHENVKLVLSGHVIPDGVARKTSLRSSGTAVHEVLTNFQMCGQCPCAEAEGGSGYLRTIEVDRNQESLRVRTYSPYLDTYLRDPENEFDLPLDGGASDE